MTEPLTYRDAGVDIDAGNEAVERIKTILKSSSRIVTGGEEVGGIGGFSGLFKPFLTGMAEPLLVASTDGVGTKLLIALETGKLDTIGQDLVAMAVNDLVVVGARPLFFLDYIATAKLIPDEIETIVGSIQRACADSDCLLIGGETAEMPGMYAPGHTDLAGFTVGIVDRAKVIDGSRVNAGDIIIGIRSSGIHSNGYSLVRKVIETQGWKWDEKFPGLDKSLVETVLAPTKLYVRPILKLIEELSGDGVKACAHITGGGLTENIPRVLPKDKDMKLDYNSWQEPAIFALIRNAANLPDEEMHRTFNCGVGFVVVVSPDDADRAVSLLNGYGEAAWQIGVIVNRST